MQQLERHGRRPLAQPLRSTTSGAMKGGDHVRGAGAATFHSVDAVRTAIEETKRYQAASDLDRSYALRTKTSGSWKLIFEADCFAGQSGEYVVPRFLLLATLVR